MKKYTVIDKEDYIYIQNTGGKDIAYYKGVIADERVTRL